MQIPQTVRVKSPVSEDNPLGYVVINKDDLTNEHELFDEVKAEEPAQPAVEPEPAAPAVTPSWQPK